MTRRFVRTLLVALAVGAATLISSAALRAGIKESCYNTGSKVDGANKICYYSCPSGEAAITINRSNYCPANITRTVQ